MSNMSTQSEIQNSAHAQLQETVLDKFKICIIDFTADLSITFPEYKFLWQKWQHPQLPEEEWELLMEYCKQLYPERFFDLLYKNEEIFSLSGTTTVSDVNSDSDDDAETATDKDVFFLPGVDFKKLYNCKGVTENTKESLWKYLQMILFLIMKTVDAASAFGETEDLFSGVNEEDLQEQMKNTLENLADFFQKEDDVAESQPEGPSEESHEKANTGHGQPRPEGRGPTAGLNGGIPDAEELNAHIKKLMGGKIGKFAEEIMAEYNKDLEEVIGDVKNAKSMRDVVGHMFKNTKKMKELLKKIQDKFKAKMDSGEISKNDVMKETKELFGKLKGMKNGKEMNQYMKTMMSQMGGMAGMAGGMNFGKNTRMDLGAMERMIKKEETASRLRAKAEASRKAKADGIAVTQTAPNTFTFKVDENMVDTRSKQEIKLEKQLATERAQKEIDDLASFIEGSENKTQKNSGELSKKKGNGKKK